MREIVIRLPMAGFIKQGLASGEYNEIITEALNPTDLVVSYIVRYDQVLAGVTKTSGQGVVVAYTVLHPEVAAAVIVLLLTASMAKAVHGYRRRRQEEEERAAQFRGTHGQVQSRLRASSRSQPGAGLDSINRRLQEALAASAELRGKYTRVEVTADGYVNLFKEAKEEVVVDNESTSSKIGSGLVKACSAAWISLGLASFVYWILWMAWGIVTGNFAAVGIGDTGTAGFILPFAIGLLYPVIKIGNWLKSRYLKGRKKVDEEACQIEESNQKKLEAAVDLSKLFHKVAYALEADRLIDELEAIRKVEISEAERAALKVKAAQESNAAVHLAGDEEILELGRHSGWKTAATFIGVVIGSFIGAQYGAWIITDALKVIVGVTLDLTGIASIVIGAAIVACSVTYGLHQAYKKYKDIKKYEEKDAGIEVSANKKIDSLESGYKKKLQQVEVLLDGLQEDNACDQEWITRQREQLSNINKIISAEPAPEEKWDVWTILATAALCAYIFLGGSMSGIMMGRVLTIVGTVTFLPFVAIALPSPATIAVLLVCGVLYGLFQLQQYHQRKREEKAKVLREERAERITCLEQQGHLLDLQLRVIQEKTAKPAEAKGEVPQPEPAKPEPSLDCGQLVEKGSAANDAVISLPRSLSPSKRGFFGEVVAGSTSKESNFPSAEYGLV